MRNAPSIPADVFVLTREMVEGWRCSEKCEQSDTRGRCICGVMAVKGMARAAGRRPFTLVVQPVGTPEVPHAR